MLSTIQRSLAKKYIYSNGLITIRNNLAPQAQRHQQNQRYRAFATRRRRPPPPSRASAESIIDTVVNSDSVNENDNGILPSNSHQAKDMIDSSPTFVARDKDGNELPMDEYLKFATLSPWVPCPDPVARKMLDISQIGPDDVHYELGSGDGRINFHAIDPPYSVKKSVGIDIDPSLIQASRERLLKRHPQPNIEFICADLLSTTDDGIVDEIWNKIKDECTVLTMYFVEDALLKIKPALERNLAGKKCKIMTIGYEVGGWVPNWEEICLGLKIYMYDMENFEEREVELTHEDFPDEFKGKGVLGGDRTNALPEDPNDPFAKGEPVAEEIEEDPNHDIEFGWDDFDDDIEEEEEDGDSKEIGEKVTTAVSSEKSGKPISPFAASDKSGKPTSPFADPK